MTFRKMNTLPKDVLFFLFDFLDKNDLSKIALQNRDLRGVLDKYYEQKYKVLLKENHNLKLTWKMIFHFEQYHKKITDEIQSILDNLFESLKVLNSQTS